MDPVTQIIGMVAVEGIKFLATYYVENKRLAGKTDTEIMDEFKAEYLEFKNSDVDKIPDPT